MKNFVIVFCSLLIVFAYAAADNAVSPLVSVFQSFFQVNQASVLYLISGCTMGIVIGTMIGPILIERYTASFIMLFAAVVAVLTTFLFIELHMIYLSVVLRFIFGICCGLLSAIIWWITFHGVSGKANSAMVAVVTAARPIAMCLGIPLVGVMTTLYSWQVAYVFLMIILIISTAVLFKYIRLPSDEITKEKKSIIKTYGDILKLPHSKKVYVGLVLNSFGYFGFYAFAGIWFLQNYHLDYLKTSILFLIIGGAEVTASFIAAWLFRIAPYRKTYFLLSMLNFLFFPLFIYGYFSLPMTMIFIMCFILLNRTIIYAVVKTIPLMFEKEKNKTPFGALITMSIWLGFSIVSGIQANLLRYMNISVMETMLTLALISGVLMLYFAERSTIFLTVEKLQ